MKAVWWQNSIEHNDSDYESLIDTLNANYEEENILQQRFTLGKKLVPIE